MSLDCPLSSEDQEHCPNCNASFDGGSIWETGLARTGSEEEADKYAECFGATRTKGRWQRKIGLYSLETDRTFAWACPDCEHQWPRE